MISHTIGTQSDRKSQKRVITVEPPYHAQVWEYPPRGARHLFKQKVVRYWRWQEAKIVTF